jgi:hypothetical protein
MKKTVLTFGLISGAILGSTMFATMPFLDKIGFDRGEVLGYTTMIVAFMFVFFGIRSYRENVGDGQITFARAFAVGILITLTASVCYVIAWEIIYFKFMPDFAAKYTGYMIEKLKASGASQQVIEAKLQEMKSLKAMLDNPLLNSAISFLEPLPVGLPVTLISALILRKKKIQGATARPQEASMQA